VAGGADRLDGGTNTDALSGGNLTLTFNAKDALQIDDFNRSAALAAAIDIIRAAKAPGKTPQGPRA